MYHYEGSSKLGGLEITLVYAHDVNILGKSIHAINKNTEALLVLNKK